MLLSITILEVSQLINGKVIGNNNVLVKKIASLDSAVKGDIVYFTNIKSSKTIQNNQASVVITTKKLQKYCFNNNIIIVENPAVAIAKISQFLSKSIHNIHTNIIIDSSAIIGNNVNIAANCVIGKNVVIGKNCYLYPNVNIMDNVIIGNNCMISSGTVIGSQGFGNAQSDDKKWHRIHHFGGVDIADNVTIGANTTIDNGTFSNTVIEKGVRIDNLVHIAHNVKIGENTAIAAKTGIAGSTIIGKNCQIGGMVGIIGHLNIVDNVIIYATSTVNKNIDKSGVYTSFLPIMPHEKWRKIAFLLTKFDKIIKFLKIKVTKL